MAFDFTVLGTNGNDSLFYFSSEEKSILLQARNGDDIAIIDSDLSDSDIFLDGGSDTLTITSTTTLNPTIRDTTIQAGAGNDSIRIFTGGSVNNGSGLIISGQDGNDTIQVSSLAGLFNARFVGTTIFGDNGSGNDGVDTVYIDNTVAAFNNSLVNLNDNGSAILAPVTDAVIDAIAAADPLNLLTLGLEGMLVQAGEVSQSTFRGGQGSDWIVFDSLFNPFGGVVPTTALDTSLVSGNQGTDAVAILRNTDNSTINGGNDADYLTAIGATLRFTRFNGNKGADLISVFDVLAQNSTFFGGQGNDVLNIFSAVTTNSVVSGDLGNDEINFLAANSTNTTLSGGEGDDNIDDFSTLLTTLGNVLDGGAGDDVLRQAANIALSGILDFGSTMIGGTGADIMTGDSSAQFISPKEANAAGTDIDGAASDLFRFSFGDSVINSQGVGHDQITDFDSDTSFYLDNGTDSTNPFNYNVQANTVGNLTALERDEIDLTNGNITFGTSKVLGNGDTAIVNTPGAPGTGGGLVTGGVDNITEFIEAGSLQTVAGQALIWTQDAVPFTTPAPFNVNTFRTSWLFISDGDGVLSDGDLLVELTNVVPTANTGGLVLNGGDITNIV